MRTTLILKCVVRVFIYLIKGFRTQLWEWKEERQIQNSNSR